MLNETVGNLINEQLESKMRKYEAVTESFKAFFDQDTLSQVLDRKADLELLNLLRDQKADLNFVRRVE